MQTIGPEGKGKRPVGGGGGSHIFVVRRFGPSIYHSPPKNIRNFKHPKKYLKILAIQKIITHSVPWPKEETLKCIEMTPKYRPILWWPPKISTKSSYPQKYSFFSKPQKYWNAKFWTPQRCQFILLATSGSEGTRYRLRYGNLFIWPFAFFKFHDNINQTESFSLWQTENTCSQPWDQTCNLDLDTPPPSHTHTQNKS